MALPISYLASFAMLLVYEQLVDRLPGEESVPRFVLAALTLLLPWVVARLATAAVARAAQRGTIPARAARLALQLQPVLMPLAYAVPVFVGDLPVFAARLAPALGLAQVVLLIGPILLMEVSVRLAVRGAARPMESVGLAMPAHLGVERLRMVLFVTVPVLGVAAAADLIGLYRPLQVFVLNTTLGGALGLIALGVVLCAGLPVLFRCIMPVSREFPPNAGAEVKSTAARLGFAPRNLLAMRTRYRLVNAALIGPLPLPRYLVLTDGLLALLDGEALRGVVAHEIGHARANHPGLLLAVFALLPVLLLYSGEAVGVGDLASGPALFAGAGAMAVALLLLRTLAHRFEFEADQMSAESLDGPSGCVRALLRVGELSPRSARRATLFHPSEASRVQHLLSCAGDPDYRRRFWRRGRRLRWAVAAALVVAVAVFTWAQLRLWPSERAGFLFECGKVQEARNELERMGDAVLPALREQRDDLRRQVDAVLELGCSEVDWVGSGCEIGQRALRRAATALVEQHDPRQALTWLTLAIRAPDAEPWLQCLFLYCRAVAQEREVDAVRIRDHALTLVIPEPFASALRAQ